MPDKEGADQLNKNIVNALFGTFAQILEQERGKGKIEVCKLPEPASNLEHNSVFVGGIRAVYNLDKWTLPVVRVILDNEFIVLTNKIM